MDDGVALRATSGLHWSWVGVGKTHGVRTGLHSVQSLSVLHAPCLGASWKASCLSPTCKCVRWAKVACMRSGSSREMQSERGTFPTTAIHSHGSRDRSKRSRENQVTRAHLPFRAVGVAALPCQVGPAGQHHGG